MEITINNVVLMFSPIDEKTPYMSRERIVRPYGSVGGRAIDSSYIKRFPAWTKPEKVLHVMALL